ncbi:MAG: hypothetical protein HY365_00120 [Candidatus Aenigmarchaeota archaeon]|nr:hypothetical protein [Candidatus Aenigmarchaeota archaeon]
MKFLFAVMILSSAAYAFTASAAGECGEFFIALNGGEKGCWDVKVDAPGKILNGGTWEDSFFYSKNAYCNGYGSVRFRTGETGDVPATIRIRQNSTTEENNILMAQACVPDDRTVLIAALAVAIALFYAVAAFRK